MNKRNEIDTTKSIFLIPTIYVVGIWVLYFVEIKFGFNFNKFGVYPRDLLGLRGVVFTHFIHSDTSHLFNNSIPLFVLLASLYSFYNQVALKVLIYGGLCTGLLTWCIARENYHIGASGIVYLLFSFVFFSGIIRKNYRLVALSLIIIFLYGSIIWYVLPIKESMSWEGHLSGFIMGLILAFIYKNKGIVKEEHQFTKTEFDLMFDSDGNFIPPEIEEKLDDKIVD